MSQPHDIFKGDGPETSALRPSRASGLVSLMSVARLPHQPGVWLDAGTSDYRDAKKKVKWGCEVIFTPYSSL
jgi:hypothetical protein